MERKRLTDEQQDAWDRQVAQNNKLEGLYHGLSFMEKNFGLVNKHVIEFRKELLKECDILNDLGLESDNLGVSDVFMYNYNISMKEQERLKKYEKIFNIIDK